MTYQHPTEVDPDDMPPCLAARLSSDPPYTTNDRVTVLRNVNIMLRKMCLPRETAVATLADLDWLDPDDIEPVVMRGIRSSSNYQCKEPVLRSVCDPVACVKRRLGICRGFFGRQPRTWLDAGLAVTDYGRWNPEGWYPMRINGLMVRLSERALRYQDTLIDEVFQQRRLRLPRISDAEFDSWVSASWPRRL